MQFDRLKRREFISLLGGVAVAWPLAVRAQQASKTYRVGLFFSSTPPAELAGPDPIIPPARAFLHGLRDLGYIEGRNLILERRTAEGKFERIPEIAAELVGRNPDAVVTGGGNFLAQALQRVSKTVPIVMPDSDDPVEAGLVAPLNPDPNGYEHKILDQIVINLQVPNNLAFTDQIHPRILLTTTIETTTVGNTILISKGLIDSLPNEAAMASVVVF